MLNDYDAENLDDVKNVLQQFGDEKVLWAHHSSTILFLVNHKPCKMRESETDIGNTCHELSTAIKRSDTLDSNIVLLTAPNDLSQPYKATGSADILPLRTPVFFPIIEQIVSRHTQDLFVSNRVQSVSCNLHINV